MQERRQRNIDLATITNTIYHLKDEYGIMSNIQVEDDRDFDLSDSRMENLYPRLL